MNYSVEDARVPIALMRRWHIFLSTIENGNNNSHLRSPRSTSEDPSTTLDQDLMSDIMSVLNYIDKEKATLPRVITAALTLSKTRRAASWDTVVALKYRLQRTSMLLRAQRRKRIQEGIATAADYFDCDCGNYRCNGSCENKADLYGVDGGRGVDEEKWQEYLDGGTLSQSLPQYLAPSSSTINKLLTRPEHFRRRDHLPSQSHPNSPNASEQSTSLSLWDGSDFKFALLKSLKRKLLLKVVFSAIHHWAFASFSNRQAALTCERVRTKKLLQMCFFSILYEALSAGFIEYRGFKKASRLYRWTMLAPAIHHLQLRRRLTIALLEREGTAELHYRKLGYRKGLLRLTIHSRKQCRRRLQKEWACSHVKRSRQGRALIGWIMSFVKHNLMKMALSARLAENLASNSNSNSSIPSRMEGQVEEGWIRAREGCERTLKRQSNESLGVLAYYMENSFALARFHHHSLAERASSSSASSSSSNGSSLPPPSPSRYSSPHSPPPPHVSNRSAEAQTPANSQTTRLTYSRLQRSLPPFPVLPPLLSPDLVGHLRRAIKSQPQLPTKSRKQDKKDDSTGSYTMEGGRSDLSTITETETGLGTRTTSESGRRRRKWLEDSNLKGGRRSKDSGIGTSESSRSRSVGSTISNTHDNLDDDDDDDDDDDMNFNDFDEGEGVKVKEIETSGQKMRNIKSNESEVSLSSSFLQGFMGKSTTTRTSKNERMRDITTGVTSKRDMHMQDSSFHSSSRATVNRSIVKERHQGDSGLSLLDAAVNMSINYGDDEGGNGPLLGHSLDVSYDKAATLVRKAKECFNLLRYNANISIASREVNSRRARHSLRCHFSEWRLAYTRSVQQVTELRLKWEKRRARVVLKAWSLQSYKRFHLVPRYPIGSSSCFLSARMIARRRSILDAFSHWVQAKRVAYFNRRAEEMATRNLLIRCLATLFYNTRIIRMVNRFSRKISLKLFRPMLAKWREKTRKRCLLKRVFRIYINACEERVATSKSNYSLMSSIVKAWRDCAVAQRILRIETTNEYKALYFRGISLKAKIFFAWVDATAVEKKARLEAEAQENAINVMKMRIIFAEFKSIWHARSAVWQQICKKHSLKVKRKVLISWDNHLTHLSNISLKACNRIHMKRFLRKLNMLAIRARYKRVLLLIAKRRLQSSFSTIRRLFSVRQKVKRASNICSNVIRNYRLKRILDNWPGRKEWAMSEALRKRRVTMGRGRIRLVDAVDPKTAKAEPPPKPENVFDKALIQAATPRLTLVQRIARMVSGISTASYNGLFFVHPPTLPELLELVTTIFGAWKAATRSVIIWRSKSRQIRSARSRKLLFEAMRHWISRSSKTSHRIMTWVQKKDSILTLNSSSQFSRFEKFRRIPGTLGAVAGPGEIGKVDW